MQTCKEHRGCRQQHGASTALSTANVARITPCRYSVRQAIDLYREIQSDEETDSYAAIVTALG